MTTFEPGEREWIDRLGNLRNVIRQELITRQIAEHIDDRRTVLDVGCGQGTQALKLLESGCTVVGVDLSPTLLERFGHDAVAAGFEVELINGGLKDLARLVDDRVFDVVCAHGVLMYLDDPESAVHGLSQRVAPGGLLSITFKNGHGLAMRPALRQQWSSALATFKDDHYVNELGVGARAHCLPDVEAWLSATDLSVRAWYGVRVFNDALAGDVLPPTDGSMADLLNAEEIAGRTDPYRWLGSQIHLLAQRS